MNNGKMIAVVGLGAILPDAFDVSTFWNNIAANRYSVTDVPADRWNVDLYYDPDPSVVDKTYSKIGAFVKGYQFDPLKSGIAIPPRVLAVMDVAQQWAIAVSQQALKDYGYPEKKLDPERVAVIFGNANAGEMHYRSTFRILLPEYLEILRSVPDFNRLPEGVRLALVNGVTQSIHSKIPAISEDTMPGELSNVIAGRVANVFNFSGPNFVTDAACASSMAAAQAACEGLLSNKFDAVLTGGIDRNMGPESYIKFSKIGALSADGSRPYAEGANGFVMGEGAVAFLLKRLEDAERDGDRIYSVICGIGGSSDGKGKGITAPNPLGQQRAIERAWKDAQINPESVGLVEGHGTSTKVGDVTEVGSMNAIFGSLGLKNGSIALGSVKSNIGHLKSAAGAVGLLKTILSLYHHVLPPSANFEKPNPNIDFANLPFKVNSQPQEWAVREGNYRFAGVSAFGFGGTNFHVVLEEYFPGIAGRISVASSIPVSTPAAAEKIVTDQTSSVVMSSSPLPGLVRNTLQVENDQVKQYVLSTVSEKTGYPVEMLDEELDLEADLGIDTVKQAELFATIRTHYGIPRREDLRLSDYNTLAKVVNFVLDAMNSSGGGSMPAAENKQDQKISEITLTDVSASGSAELRPYQGLYFASADSPDELLAKIEADFQALANGVLPPSRCPSTEELSRKERIALDYADTAELTKRLEKAITVAKKNDPVMWKALQAHGVYRGSGKPGKVAFLFPGQGSQYVNMLLDLRDTEPVVKDTFDEADKVLTPILGRPLTSFIYTQGGEEEMQQAEKELKDTTITQPAMLTTNVAMLRVLQKYGVEPDLVIGHSLGEYAALVAAGVLTFAEALEVVSARGREMTKIKVDDQGCMAAVSAPLEKVEEVIRSIEDYVVIANINSPVQCVLGGSTKGIDLAINRFQADGLQAVKIPVSHAFHTKIVASASVPLRQVISRMNVLKPVLPIVANVTGELYPTERDDILDILASQVESPVQFVKGIQTLYEQGVRIFIEAGPKRVLNSLATDNLKDKSDVTIIATNHPRKGGKASFNEALCGMYAAGIPSRKGGDQILAASKQPDVTSEKEFNLLSETIVNGEIPLTGSVVISGAGLGLPGRNRHVFEDSNIESILNGDMRIEQLPDDSRNGMLEKHVTRLVKSDAGAVMEEINDIDQVLKLAGQGGQFDLVKEFGVPQERVESLDVSTQLAIAAGIEALRDAGIPLVMHYRKTTKGTFLPDRWKLPESMQDETGVIFCSAFPGLNRMAEEAERFYETKILERELQSLRATVDLVNALCPTGLSELQNDLQRRIIATESRIKEADYHFDRRYVFRILSMGHSQFAEYIGAKGPNAHVNAACASTTQGIAVAEDWIRSGRCRRVIVIAGDDVTNPTLVSWIGTSLFASGAATTEGDLRLAALPFDKRRNGMIMGMGAAALVIEGEDAAKERGVRAIGEILSSIFANSAFHGTRLDVQHVTQVMDQLISTAERRFGINRGQIAPQTVFVSHETYTPARGGSASAEIHALRYCFGDLANKVVIANTKGFTGHTMGVGIEDVIAVKSLESGKVPPIAHIQDGFEPDPELGDLNLSKGGVYNPRYYLRLGAGFGSQIAMTLVRKIPGVGERIDREKYNQWLLNAAGYDQVDLEVVHHTLRIKSRGVPTREPARSTWRFGQVPAVWAAKDESGFERTPVNTVDEVSTVTTQPSIANQNVKKTEQPETESISINANQVNASSEEIKQYVLSVVSEKTGYPVEMLDLDLDLEADLGIDTVKQAELFATIRSNYGIPRREDLVLADYNTLAKVITFMQTAIDGVGSIQNLSKGDQPAVEPVQSVDFCKVETNSVEAPMTDSSIKDYVLSVVSDKTGYPVEMLDLDLDLEADLGIDTVKQAELFATVRTHYGIARGEDLRLSDYNTLAKVIGFMQDGDSKEETANPMVALQSQSSADDQSKARIDTTDTPAVVQESPHTIAHRIPVPVLLPRLDLCQMTGVQLEGSRVIVVGDKSKISLTLVKELKTYNAEVFQVSLPEAAQQFEEIVNSNKVNGLYFLPSLNSDPDWSTENDSEYRTIKDNLVSALYQVARTLPKDAFILAATRMGGLHGFIEPANPLGGVVSGFMKALRRERPEQLIKVIDFEEKAGSAVVAEHLVAETLHDPISVEIGREGHLRYGIVLQQDALHLEGGGDLKEGSVFIVSGGTGGITGAIVRDLAQAARGTFYLMGRSAIDPEDPELLSYKKDPGTFRQDLQARMIKSGEKVTPVQLEQKLSALERAAGTLDVIRDVERFGAKAVYLQCDVTDLAGVKIAVEKISKAEKEVDVFIHAAGLEISRKIDSKSLEEVQQVVAVKADGFLNIFRALERSDRLPKKVVFFSSVAGRFGNSGQTDYSAANDLLSKYSLWLPKRYPKLQVVSIDWGAWAEVGMASRGRIPALMKMAGIEMLQPNAAAPAVRNFLDTGYSGEVVIAGSLGILDQPAGENGGMDIAKGDTALRAGTPIHKMLSHLVAYDHKTGIKLEAELNPVELTYLLDHSINGTPVLPGVMGIEGFSIAAKHISSTLASDGSEFDIERLENIKFLAPFKFYGNKPRILTWYGFAFRTSTGLTVRVSLESDNIRRNGQVEHIVHFEGLVHLSQKPAISGVIAEPPKWGRQKSVSAEEIYRLYFHGPSFQVLEAAQRSENVILGRLNKQIIGIHSDDHGLFTTPMLIELCFQTAGLWEVGATGTMALPQSIGTLRVYKQPLNGTRIYAEVTPLECDGQLSFDARVLDAKGNLFLELTNYRTSPMPDPVEKVLAKPMKVLVNTVKATGCG